MKRAGEKCAMCWIEKLGSEKSEESRESDRLGRNWRRAQGTGSLGDTEKGN